MDWSRREGGEDLLVFLQGAAWSVPLAAGANVRSS